MQRSPTRRADAWAKGNMGFAGKFFLDFDPNPGRSLFIFQKHRIGCETIDQDEEYAPLGKSLHRGCLAGWLGSRAFQGLRGWCRTCGLPKPTL